MKRVIFLLSFCLGATVLPSGRATAQIEIIGEVIKAAIMAADIAIQKVQTETIVLQNAAKEAENLMQRTRLGEITNWVQQQKGLYESYYQELWQVKNSIATYQKIKTMIEKQSRMVTDYQRAHSLVQQDPHFSATEVKYIYQVYQGILTESITNVGQLTSVINALITQMTDGDRLRIIDATSTRIDKNYNDLERFTQENMLLSLQRSKDQQDSQFIRSLYGIF